MDVHDVEIINKFINKRYFRIFYLISSYVHLRCLQLVDT